MMRGRRLPDRKAAPPQTQVIKKTLKAEIDFL